MNPEIQCSGQNLLCGIFLGLLIYILYKAITVYINFVDNLTLAETETIKSNTVLTPKAAFHQNSSKVVFYQKLSSIKCCLPSKVVFHQRLSSIKIKGCLPSS